MMKLQDEMVLELGVGVGRLHKQVSSLLLTLILLIPFIVPDLYTTFGHRNVRH